jgi:hypothetical protein
MILKLEAFLIHEAVPPAVVLRSSRAMSRAMRPAGELEGEGLAAGELGVPMRCVVTVKPTTAEGATTAGPSATPLPLIASVSTMRDASSAPLPLSESAAAGA